jgi:transcriptional regulator GlxA family with amidase domain
MKRNVALLLFDDVEVLDFAGPLEVFAVANALHGGALFNVFTFAVSPGTIRTRAGLKVVPDFTVENCPPPHVLIVPGGDGTRALLGRASLLEWLRHKSRTAEIVMSVCTGALVLGQAGLLDGLRATTHHASFARLRQVAPTTDVIENERYVDNGRIVTAGGIAAGIDCALHVIERLAGRESAEATARYLEYPRR